jgi:hypothetical protein
VPDYAWDRKVWHCAGAETTPERLRGQIEGQRGVKLVVQEKDLVGNKLSRRWLTLKRANTDAKAMEAAPLREVDQPALQRQAEISASVHDSLQTDLRQEPVYRFLESLRAARLYHNLISKLAKPVATNRFKEFCARQRNACRLPDE